MTSFPRTSCGCTSSSPRRWDAEAGSSTSRCSTSEDPRLKVRSSRSTTNSGTPTALGLPCSSILDGSSTTSCPTSRWAARCKIGQSYTLLVRSEWQDANGLPLKESFRRTFRVGPPDTPSTRHRAVADRAAQGRRQTPLVVTFPEPVDHGLLFRALGVRRSGEVVDGNVTVDRQRDAVVVHTAPAVAGRRTTICSRCRSWKIAPAIRSAAPSKWTTSRPSTKVQTRAP